MSPESKKNLDPSQWEARMRRASDDLNVPPPDRAWRALAVGLEGMPEPRPKGQVRRLAVWLARVAAILLLGGATIWTVRPRVASWSSVNLNSTELDAYYADYLETARGLEGYAPVSEGLPGLGFRKVVSGPAEPGDSSGRL